MATIRTLRARPPPASSGVPERSSWLSPATSGGVSGRSSASQSSTASWPLLSALASSLCGRLYCCHWSASLGRRYCRPTCAARNAAGSA
ncbi:Uncharacterised protein [Acinetobacter baumannii]|nr:Uncharacterised protein [Acinetobacter baumannii]